MRIFKQVTKDGKPIITLSLWGEDDHEEDIKALLEELLERFKEEE